MNPDSVNYQLRLWESYLKLSELQLPHLKNELIHQVYLSCVRCGARDTEVNTVNI